ncbi:hypothetical protein D8Y24_02870 [Agrococcus lahaulensis]|uniref:hypothetical protein n=1 Tax=Agrococcus sediminis TaxID=2599924 RepID=UPI000FE34C68|nr:hypothetical protein D8Y24_02870 [Agrococcus lahaulensis]
MSDDRRDEHPLLAAFRDDPAPRSRKPWTEEDFAAVMEACRDGASIEQIARRLGRTPTSLPMHVRRMLPLEERHLPIDLALPRLRQLDADGDYDWLGALAQREPSPWERDQERRVEQRALGLGGLSDELLLDIGLALVTSTATAQDALRQQCAAELRRRGLVAHLEQQSAAAADAAVARLSALPTDGYRDWDAAVF